MTSFEEYCPLWPLWGVGLPGGGGFACAWTGPVPKPTRTRTRETVRIRACIACSIRRGSTAGYPLAGVLTQLYGQSATESPHRGQYYVRSAAPAEVGGHEIVATSL